MKREDGLDCARGIIVGCLCGCAIWLISAFVFWLLSRP